MLISVPRTNLIVMRASNIRAFQHPLAFTQWVRHTVISNFLQPIFLKLFISPQNMPKTVDKAESRMLEACAAAKREKKPNVSKIAREYGVSRRTLHNRVKNGMQAHTCRKPVYKALKGYQEEALKQWVARMRNLNMPVPPQVIQAWADRALSRAGKTERVSKMWVYRFVKRLPEGLKLHPVKQKTKESKRTSAERIHHRRESNALCSIRPLRLPAGRMAGESWVDNYEVILSEFW